MLFPFVFARMKKRNFFSCCGIDSGSVSCFGTVTIKAGPERNCLICQSRLSSAAEYVRGGKCKRRYSAVPDSIHTGAALALQPSRAPTVALLLCASLPHGTFFPLSAAVWSVAPAFAHFQGKGVPRFRQAPQVPFSRQP